MEFRQLEIFRILARELSFTRAARLAHCVQSNVTVQIRSMEDELGVPLFERLGRQIRLTAHGQNLLPYSERILGLLQEARTVVASSGHPSGTLRIGSPESLLTYRLPPILQVFRERYPQVDLIFRSVAARDMGGLLEQGDLDFGLIIDDPLEDPHLEVESLCVEPLVLLTNPQHPLAACAEVLPNQLSSQTLLLTDSACTYRAKFLRSLEQFKIEPRSVMEFTSVEAIKECAALGMGVACLPAIVAQAEISLAKLSVLVWAGPELTMQTQITRHKDKWMSPAMEAFLALLHEQVPQIR